MILLFQEIPLHAASLHSFAVGDLWAMGSALSWALYCSLLRLKDRRIPANGFVAVSSLLGALILVPIVIFWLMRHRAGLGSLARAVLPQRPGVSGNFPVMAGLSVLEQRYRQHWCYAGEIYTHIIPLSGGVEYPLPAHPAAGLAPVQRAVYHAGDCHLLPGKTPGDRAPGHARSQKLTAGGERLVMSASGWIARPSRPKGQDGNDNRHRPATRGHCQAVVMPMMLGD